MRGMMLPTALFMSLLLFLLCTVMVWQARDNLRFTRLEAERSRHTFLAKAMANELLAAMAEDPTLEAAYGKDSPLARTEEGVEVRAWVEPDPQHPEVLHVHGTATPPGGAVQHFTRVVVKGPEPVPVLFAEDLGSRGTSLPGLPGKVLMLVHPPENLNGTLPSVSASTEEGSWWQELPSSVESPPYRKPSPPYGKLIQVACQERTMFAAWRSDRLLQARGQALYGSEWRPDESWIQQDRWKPEEPPPEAPPPRDALWTYQTGPPLPSPQGGETGGEGVPSWKNIGELPMKAQDSEVLPLDWIDGLAAAGPEVLLWATPTAGEPQVMYRAGIDDDLPTLASPSPGNPQGAWAPLALPQGAQVDQLSTWSNPATGERGLYLRSGDRLWRTSLTAQPEPAWERVPLPPRDHWEAYRDQDQRTRLRYVSGGDAPMTQIEATPDGGLYALRDYGTPSGADEVEPGEVVPLDAVFLFDPARPGTPGWGEALLPPVQYRWGKTPAYEDAPFVPEAERPPDWVEDIRSLAVDGGGGLYLETGDMIYAAGEQHYGAMRKNKRDASLVPIRLLEASSTRGDKFRYRPAASQ